MTRAPRQEIKQEEPHRPVPIHPQFHRAHSEGYIIHGIGTH